jgi:type VI secretion system protein ImpK
MSENEGFAVTAVMASSVPKESLRSLLDQMTLARAAELARAGHYAEAEEILSAGKDETRYGPVVIDLLARIHAQQGRLEEAEKLWTRAVLLDPANSTYVLALRRAAALRHGSRRPRIVLSLVAGVILCALIGLWRWQYSPKARSTEMASTPGAQTQPAATSGQSPMSLQQPPATSQDLRLAAAQAPIKNDIYVRGITVTKGPAELIVSFDDGLFQRGLFLKPGARARLRELGRQLKPYASNSAVRIVGMTDELPMSRRARYRDNVLLGMDRARFVYDYLRFTSGFDSHDFTIGSSRQTPGQNDQTINRARSRTVVLHITGKP